MHCKTFHSSNVFLPLSNTLYSYFPFFPIFESYTILDNCWLKEVDTSYQGETIFTKMSVPSYESCQQVCKDESGCVGFNYMTNKYSNTIARKRCKLFASIKSTKSEGNVISGKNTCSGEYIAINHNFFGLETNPLKSGVEKDAVNRLFYLDNIKV